MFYTKYTYQIIRIACLSILTCAIVLSPLRVSYSQVSAFTSDFTPILIRGMRLDAANPLHFNFIIDAGTQKFSEESLKIESEKLIKYYLAALTTPDEDSWVNLSPVEKDRIMPDSLALTDMGKVMLEQDYLLKQLASSLTNPATDLGKKYWEQVNHSAANQGAVAPEMKAVSKVWIVPGVAEIYEQNGQVVIGQTHLKVVLDVTEKDSVSRKIFQDMILPEIEKEVNVGKDFAPVRQVYQSVILAVWFKEALNESLLGKTYVDQNKTAGIETGEKDTKEKVYQKYIQAFQKGVYSTIQEEVNPATQEIIPRKYFSGGIEKLGKMTRLVLLINKENPSEIATRPIGQTIEVSTLLEEPPVASSSSIDDDHAKNMRMDTAKAILAEFREQGLISGEFGDVEYTPYDFLLMQAFLKESLDYLREGKFLGLVPGENMAFGLLGQFAAEDLGHDSNSDFAKHYLPRLGMIDINGAQTYQIKDVRNLKAQQKIIGEHVAALMSPSSSASSTILNRTLIEILAASPEFKELSATEQHDLELLLDTYWSWLLDQDIDTVRNMVGGQMPTDEPLRDFVPPIIKFLSKNRLGKAYVHDKDFWYRLGVDAKPSDETKLIAKELWKKRRTAWVEIFKKFKFVEKALASNPETGVRIKGLPSSSSPVGGINFNRSQFSLQIKRDNNGIPLPLLSQDLSHIQLRGLQPYIIQIQPVSLEKFFAVQ